MRFLSIQAYLRTLKGLFHNMTYAEPVFPFYASFKLTSRCHFGCPFCNVKKDPVPDLSTADIKAVLRNLSRSPVLMTSFEGGEPLLRPDIGELLKYARSCSFYLLFTTSVKNLETYPLEEYAKYIDFLHVSIDEGHDNLELFEKLPYLCRLPLDVSVQTVVTSETIDSLDEKVKRCYDCGSNIVIIPAAKMDNAQDLFPDMESFAKKLKYLRKLYPNTIHTPSGFFDAYKRGKCSSSSVIIAPDARLYYPCHILGTKGPDLRVTDLSTWLRSQEAVDMRKTMQRCSRNCGWYQYYAINSYTSVSSVIDTLKPVLIKKSKDRKQHATR